ncbi:MAG: protein kinase, partial [Candidatus Korobacteraceae bacterium]
MSWLRWQQLSRLYHSALERDPGQRAAYLEQACAGDSELRKELESLLAHGEKEAIRFLKVPAIPVALRLVANAQGQGEGQSLMGQQLGGYEILALIGKGGMGEVYHARDAKLGRDVALKVLPLAFADNPERLARFEREARALAALNHPNIATIHGLEQSDGLHYLVMELVPGQTLAELLSAGSIPMTEAMGIASQIAEGLESAHERGLIHRDLKPANVKLMPEGRVKLLDFGLAKALRGEAGPTTVAEPSLTGAGGEEGKVLGTPSYMSPEQARGKPVDKRTDIWAFGCVLYELLTRRQAFAGETISEILVAVLDKEPDWKVLPRKIPLQLSRLLRRCLQKDKSQRLHDIADARIEIEDILAAPPAADKRNEESVPRRYGWWWASSLILAAVAASITGVTVWRFTIPVIPLAAHFSDELPHGQSFTNTGHALVAVSPDGSKIAFVSNSQLYLRYLNQVGIFAIRGTSGSPSAPFFSPDGRSLGYLDFREGRLKRIPVEGGTPTILAETRNLFGASWNADDTILYGHDDGISRVSASGGTPEKVISIEPGEMVQGPQMLPDRNSVLFTLASGPRRTAWDRAQIVVQSLATGNREVIWKGGSDARYVPTGHLVFAVGEVLFTVPFNVATHRVAGSPVPIVEGIRRATLFPGSTGTANYDISTKGTLVYIPAQAAWSVARSLLVVDHKGNVSPLLKEKRDYRRPRISPDGRQVAVEVFDGRVYQTWIVDIQSGAARPLTFKGASLFPSWSSDGKSVVFRVEEDSYRIYRKHADGSGEADLLFQSHYELIPTDVSVHDVLVFTAGAQTGESTLWTLRLKDKSASKFLDTTALEDMGMFSPDGNWLAYVSNESGQSEIYIRPYPATEGSVRRVSEGGGSGPIWSHDGSELYYRPLRD